ncbi:MAG: hypothetical protein V2B18_02190 [Pseudomonadota bacterium]
MKSWRERFQAMAAAVAFAEEGEWDTARSLITDQRSRVDDGQPDLKKRPDRRPNHRSYQL